MGELDGQVAIVTGAGTGIGVSIARQLAEAGATLVISAYSSFEGAENLAESISDAGGTALAVKSDFRNASNAAAVVDTAIDSFGRVDIVVNNAGFTLDKDFVDCTDQDWDDLLSINLKSMFVTCSAAVPHLISRGYGRIVNLSSVHSVQHVPGFVLYGTTKGAINAFTQAMAVELAPHKITVNAIAPGAIYVPRYDRTGRDTAEIVKAIPAGTLGDIDDIGRAALFLASPAAGYINGEVMFIDGALTSGMRLGA